MNAARFIYFCIFALIAFTAICAVDCYLLNRRFKRLKKRLEAMADVGGVPDNRNFKEIK